MTSLPGIVSMYYRSQGILNQVDRTEREAVLAIDAALSESASFLSEQSSVFNEFYATAQEYWADQTLVQAMGDTLFGISENAQEGVAHSGPLAQAWVGTGAVLTGLVAGIPVCIQTWAKQVVEESPKGIWSTVYKLGEVSVKGIIAGLGYVGDQGIKGMDAAGKIYDGSIDLTSWQVTTEVTGTLATLGLIVLGVKGLAKGGGKINGSFGEAPALAYVYGGIQAGRLAVNMAQLGGGASQAMGGLVLMAASNQEGEAQQAPASGRGASKGRPDEELVVMPGGRTVQGSKMKDISFDNESPVHIAELSSFRVQKAGTTNALWFEYWSRYCDVPYAVIGRESETGYWLVVARGRTEAELHTLVGDRAKTTNGCFMHDGLVLDASSLTVQRVVPANPMISPKGFQGGAQPVVNLTWPEALAAQDGIGRIIDGKPRRLPTEAEANQMSRGPIVNVAQQMQIEGVQPAQLADFVMGPEIRSRYKPGRYGRYEDFVEIDPNTMAFGAQVLTDPNHPQVATWMNQGRLGAWRVASTEPGYLTADLWSSIWDSRSETRPVTEGHVFNGLLDPAGNVWEWNNDWYGAYPKDIVMNPTGPPTGQYRVLRGGPFWRDIDPRNGRAARRSPEVDFGTRNNDVGSRGVVSL